MFLFFCFIFSPARAEEILNWQDCLAEAKKNHPDLISAVENINQQKAGKDIEKSALFPQVDASLSAASTTTKTSSSKVTADTYSYGVSGTQLIFDGFNTVNRINAAGANIDVAAEGYRFTSSEVRLNLRTAFINLMKAQELIRVTQDIAKIRRGNLELITLSYESGLEHKGALLTSEANLAQADFEFSQAKRDITLAQRQLNKELGRREFIPMLVKEDFTVRDSAKDKPDLDVLVKGNPSWLEALAKKNVASFNLRSAYSDFYPALSGSGGANKKSNRWPPEDDSWNWGLSLTMPIFEGGLRFAKVSQAKAALNQADAVQRSTKDAAVVSLEQTWTSLQDTIETVEVQRKLLIAAQERSNIAEAQYSLGLISFDNWTIIEDDLVSAKKGFLNAQANALLAEANWIQAKGETLEYAQK